MFAAADFRLRSFAAMLIRRDAMFIATLRYDTPRLSMRHYYAASYAVFHAYLMLRIFYVVIRADDFFCCALRLFDAERCFRTPHIDLIAECHSDVDTPLFSAVLSSARRHFPAMPLIFLMLLCCHY